MGFLGKSKPKGGPSGLHEALNQRKGDAVIKPLITEEAAKTKDEDGKLPLHVAVVKNTSPEMVQLIVDKYPQAAMQPDSYGFLALHKALSFKATDAVIKIVLVANPDAVAEKDKHGSLPLHTATLRFASDSVFAFLVDCYPDACKTKNSSGNLPLHISYNATAAAVKLLISAYPEALKTTNNDGNLPLHAHIKQNASVDMIKVLLANYPEAMSAKGKGEALPIELAEEGPVKSVLELFQTDAGRAKVMEEVFGKLDLDGARARLDALEKQKADMLAKVAAIDGKIEEARAELTKLESQAAVQA